MSSRPPVFVAWTSRTGRAEELSDALGGTALGVFPHALGAKAFFALRYLASSVITVAKLTSSRPRAVIVTHPPIVAAAVVGTWALLARRPFVIDAHPTAFGAKGHLVSRLALPLHRFLARRAAGLIVASEPWAKIARSWGANPVVVHEAPKFELAERVFNERPVMVFPGIFGGDEPVVELVEAARRLPDVDFRIFGDLRRARTGLTASAPPNVTFTGWLDAAEYEREMRAADGVVALTTEPGSIMRAACEAVFMGRPLVVSRSPDLEAAFPDAVHVDNSPEGIASGVARACETIDELFSKTQRAREFRLKAWNDQLAGLKALLGT